MTDPLSVPVGTGPDELFERFSAWTADRGLTLYPHQEEALLHLLEGSNVVLATPTGSGKSMCFQLPAVVDGGLTVVVSPLIALMEDQVSALRQAGVAAAALHSELEEGERGNLFRDLSRGALKLLYVSPERLTNEATLARLDEMRIALFAIDEQTLAYLRLTGREEEQIALVEAYAKEQGFWIDPAAADGGMRERQLRVGEEVRHALAAVLADFWAFAAKRKPVFPGT